MSFKKVLQKLQEAKNPKIVQNPNKDLIDNLKESGIAVMTKLGFKRPTVSEKKVGSQTFVSFNHNGGDLIFNISWLDRYPDDIKFRYFDQMQNAFTSITNKAKPFWDYPIKDTEDLKKCIEGTVDAWGMKNIQSNWFWMMIQ